MAVVIVTRTVDLSDLTPKELAYVFTEMVAAEQAEFFSQIWAIANTWPGAGWCMQSCAIVEMADGDARSAINTLAEHLVLAS